MKNEPNDTHIPCVNGHVDTTQLLIQVKYNVV